MRVRSRLSFTLLAPSPERRIKGERFPRAFYFFFSPHPLVSFLFGENGPGGVQSGEEEGEPDGFLLLSQTQLLRRKIVLVLLRSKVFLEFSEHWRGCIRNWIKPFSFLLVSLSLHLYSLFRFKGIFDGWRTPGDPLQRHCQAGSLTGAVHLSNGNAGVLRRAQRGQKPRVEQKGKSWLDPDFQYEYGPRKRGLSILLTLTSF